VDKDLFKEKDALQGLVDAIQKAIPEVNVGKIEFDEEHISHRVELQRQGFRKLDLSEAFIESPEYRNLAKLYMVIKDLGGPPYKVLVKDEEREAVDSTELLNLVLGQAKKGLSIQRYKGLGEMNPQQLWDTTMDAEKRTLLQVSVDDTIGADEVFTILMGDAVEPRKDFITKHALEAQNIDV